MSTEGLLKVRVRASVMRAASVERAKKDFTVMQTTLDRIDEGILVVTSRRPEMLQMSADALTLLTTMSFTRFAIKDVIDIVSGKGGIPDMISLASTLILLYFQIIRLQQIAAAQQATLLGISAGAAIPIAVGLGLLAGAQQTQRTGRSARTRGGVIDRRAITRQARRLGV
jgi:hypothetical protein